MAVDVSLRADESQASNGLRLGTNFLSDAENQNIVTLDSTKQETIPQKIWRIEALLHDPLEILRALIAVRIQPAVVDWLLYAHRSAEPGHILMLNALKAETLLELGMRLGEGSGAGVAVPVLRLACALHNDMATFAEAGVSEKI